MLGVFSFWVGILETGVAGFCHEHHDLVDVKWGADSLRSVMHADGLAGAFSRARKLGCPFQTAFGISWTGQCYRKHS